MPGKMAESESSGSSELSLGELERMAGVADGGGNESGGKSGSENGGESGSESEGGSGSESESGSESGGDRAGMQVVSERKEAVVAPKGAGKGGVAAGRARGDKMSASENSAGEGYESESNSGSDSSSSVEGDGVHGKDGADEDDEAKAARLVDEMTPTRRPKFAAKEPKASAKKIVVPPAVVLRAAEAQLGESKGDSVVESGESSSSSSSNSSGSAAGKRKPQRKEPEKREPEKSSEESAPGPEGSGAGAKEDAHTPPGRATNGKSAKSAPESPSENAVEPVRAAAGELPAVAKMAASAETTTISKPISKATSKKSAAAKGKLATVVGRDIGNGTVPAASKRTLAPEVARAKNGKFVKATAEDQTAGEGANRAAAAGKPKAVAKPAVTKTAAGAKSTTLAKPISKAASKKSAAAKGKLASVIGGGIGNGTVPVASKSASAPEVVRAKNGMFSKKTAVAQSNEPQNSTAAAPGVRTASKTLATAGAARDTPSSIVEPAATAAAVVHPSGGKAANKSATAGKVNEPVQPAVPSNVQRKGKGAQNAKSKAKRVATVEPAPLAKEASALPGSASGALPSSGEHDSPPGRPQARSRADPAPGVASSSIEPIATAAASQPRLKRGKLAANAARPIGADQPTVSEAPLNPWGMAPGVAAVANSRSSALAFRLAYDSASLPIHQMYCQELDMAREKLALDCEAANRMYQDMIKNAQKEHEQFTREAEKRRSVSLRDAFDAAREGALAVSQQETTAHLAGILSLAGSGASLFPPSSKYTAAGAVANEPVGRVAGTEPPMDVDMDGDGQQSLPQAKKPRAKRRPRVGENDAASPTPGDSNAANVPREPALKKRKAAEKPPEEGAPRADGVSRGASIPQSNEAGKRVASRASRSRAKKQPLAGENGSPEVPCASKAGMPKASVESVPEDPNGPDALQGAKSGGRVRPREQSLPEVPADGERSVPVNEARKGKEHKKKARRASGHGSRANGSSSKGSAAKDSVARVSAPNGSTATGSVAAV